jgi:Antibiotic biosynthesis monooxygenase
MTVVVVATVYPASGRADEVRAALLRAVPRVHAEDGCELYALHESADRLVPPVIWTSRCWLLSRPAGRTKACSDPSRASGNTRFPLHHEQAEDTKHE